MIVWKNKNRYNFHHDSLQETAHGYSLQDDSLQESKVSLQKHER